MGYRDILMPENSPSSNDDGQLTTKSRLKYCSSVWFSGSDKYCEFNNSWDCTHSKLEKKKSPKWLSYLLTQTWSRSESVPCTLTHIQIRWRSTLFILTFWIPNEKKNWLFEIIHYRHSDRIHFNWEEKNGSYTQLS